MGLFFIPQSPHLPISPIIRVYTEHKRMPTKKKPKKDRLREKAEKLLSKKPKAPPKIEDKDIKKLVHELQVHQIELEMQNDELQRAQAIIEESRSRYSDLYDCAPAGYFTLTGGGEILEVNLTGACLLNIERTKLLHRPFSLFVEPSYRDIFSEHCRQALRRGEETKCEFKMVRRGGGGFYAFVNSISATRGSSLRVRTIVTDITQRKQAEEEIRRLNKQLEQRIIELRESEARLRLFSSQRINIQESERKRIAIEIHDDLGQSLNGIKFKIQNTIQRFKEEENVGAIKNLEELIPVIQEAIEDARRIQMDLRPSLLDDLGIVATISWFCRKFQNTYTGIQVDTRLDIDEEGLPNALKTVIYRTLQEAMNNVAKHSGASKVLLFLTNKGKGVELTIRDNGQGFDPDEALSRDGARRGSGLTSMRQRTEFSGGTFSIESNPGQGTTIRMTWPT
jgi:PAS domain S-box-containing protein